MKISILCVGKMKEKYFVSAVEEYAKRLGRYCSLEIVEVADEKTPDKASAAEEEQIRRREGDRLTRVMKSDAYTITLEIDGTMMDSIAFSRKLDGLGVCGISHIQFVIGGSLGLSREVRQASDLALSFSKMTFPHQLMRVILLEQIYRSYRIIRGEPYHK